MAKFFFCILIFIIPINLIFSQGVTISNENLEPHSSAILDIVSSQKGILLPRLTTLERDAITSPAESLIIFNTDTKCFETYIYDQWQSIWCAEAPCIESVTPTGIAGVNNICDGDNTDLSVEGGSLGSGADWYWYTVSCGGTPSGTGNAINVSPSVNTIYYVRAEGDCNTTDCVQITVTVSDIPGIPVANAATGIGETDFTANWTVVTGATSYTLEIATDAGFLNLVYNNNVGNVTQQYISGLECGTDYFYRLKAVNACGESNYSSSINLTTDPCAGCDPIFPCPGTPSVSYHGFTYNTVEIGGQCWMVENLRTTKYRNSTDITEAQSNAEWSATGTDGRYCNPGGTGDGYLYNFYAAGNAANICPFGWRTPTEADFNTLASNATDGNSLKDNILWNGTNECGWTGRNGGYRAGNGTYFDSQHGYWWSTTHAGSNYYVDFRLYDNGGLQINTWGSERPRGHYVRCIKE